MKLKLLTLFTILSFTFSNAQTTDQSHTGTSAYADFFDETNIFGQSFTAGLTGALTEISLDIQINSCSEPLTSMAMSVDIIDGDGFGGIVLATEAILVPIPYSQNMYTVSFSTPPAVVSTQKYTIRITADPNQICRFDRDGNPSPASGYWWLSVTNSYTGGMNYTNGTGNASWDFYFTTTVDTTLGVDQFSINENNLSIFPNPTRQDINIALQDNNISSIRVIDLLGKEVYSKNNINTPEYKLTLKQNPGLYILVITDDNGITVNRKILKE